MFTFLRSWRWEVAVDAVISLLFAAAVIVVAVIIVMALLLVWDCIPRLLKTSKGESKHV